MNGAFADGSVRVLS
ncbi:MAG: hypothetical protein K6A90_14595 [Lachnospiraceae bacterium]|nr:hypothetical protein [Lachnospiraceae bacterium]